MSYVNVIHSLEKAIKCCEKNKDVGNCKLWIDPNLIEKFNHVLCVYLSYVIGYIFKDSLILDVLNNSLCTKATRRDDLK